jgi:site-specific DNA-methyltransferase (adenine-specific)
MKPDKIYTGRSTIRMYNCDCMELLNSGKKWDLAIVDPPYGIGATVTIGAGDLRSGRKAQNKWGSKTWDNERPTKAYFDELKQVSKNQIIFGGNYFADLLDPSRCWIVWDKMQRVNQADAELAWTSFTNSVRVYQYHCSKLQGFQNPNRFHPTEKPTQLYKWLLTNYAKEGDTILDTHGGSFSIAIACWDLGFDLDICELDTDYFNDAVKRFEQHISQTQLF